MVITILFDLGGVEKAHHLWSFTNKLFWPFSQISTYA